MLSPVSFLAAAVILLASSHASAGTGDGSAELKPGFFFWGEGPANVFRYDSGEAVGEAAFFTTSSHALIAVTTKQTQCYLSKVYFGNLPFVSPVNLKQKTVTFQIPLKEIEPFFCDFEQAERKIRGEVMSVCPGEDGVEIQFHEYFEKEIRCNRALPRFSPAEMPAINPLAYIERTFHMRIPKTGSNSAVKMLQTLMSELQGPTGKWWNGYKTVCEIRGTYDVDNSSGEEFFGDPSGTQWDIESGRQGCIFVAGEHPFFDIPTRRYTVMRDPREHVLSQYFHCAESDYGLNTFTASLDEYLEARLKHYQAEVWTPLDPKYECFDPANLHNSYLKLEKPGDLKDAIDFVGLTSELVTSSCIEIIQVTGLVPKSCDCSASAPNLREGRDLKELGEVHVDHGVKHHGGSFEPTEKQIALIDELTWLDRQIYDEAKRLFREEVARTERLHGIRLC